MADGDPVLAPEHTASASSAITTHAAAGDPHTGYRLESADHSHASSGLEGGQISHGDLSNPNEGWHDSEYIPLEYLSFDGDLLTFFEDEIVSISVGNPGDVLTPQLDGSVNWSPAPLLTAYKDADQEVTNATLVSDSELTVDLYADGKYQFDLKLFFLNDGAAEGVKVSLAGTATVTDVKGMVSIYDDTLNSLVAFGRITSLGGAGIGAGISAGSNYVRIEGAIEITTAGTLLLQFAQNAAGAGLGVHCEVGSSMVVTKLETLI